MSNADVYYSTNINYEEIKDEDLINIIKNGNKQALDYLINKYKFLVNMKINKYYIIGAEREDIMQEGLIGLFKAIQNFQPDKQNSFKSFANLCIERQLITVIKSSNRQKHIPLNSYLSLNISAYEGSDLESTKHPDLIEILNTHLVEDPLDTITQKEYYQNIESVISKSLSNFEKKVLNYYIQGESYNKIAQVLNTPVKSIDNAIQRIRKKAIKGIPNE